MFSFATLETGLTVGEISGLISGAVSILQNVLPLVFALILLGIVQQSQHNPATWSSISNQLQGTLWPLLLRGDGSAAKSVRWRVQTMSGLALFGSLCLTIAGFLTPKPLTEDQRASHKEYTAQFSYAPDLSFFGQGTLPRPDGPVHRICGWNKYVDCPGTIYEDPVIRNKYPNHTVVNSTIPITTSLTFFNTTPGNTIASPMEIEYRNYYQETDKYVDDADVNVQGSLQPLETMLLDNRYLLIEGLVVDAMNGGIGFRNHTVPIELELGAEWNEDLLWISPETACTAVNLSLHFSISAASFFDTDNGYMTDDGGFSNLDPNIPTPRLDGPEDSWQDAFGESPDLQQRSFALAWWNNQFTARVLNISSSSVGDRYTDEFFNYAKLASPSSITISDMNGWYLDSVYYSNDTAEAANFTSYGRRCSGFNDTDASNSTKPYVRCGYFYGVPYPSQVSDGQSYRYDLNSNWTQQLYTCASTMKASIQTVTFSSNTTNASTDLSALNVLNVQPKSYNDTPPIWAVEKVDGYAIQDISLFWGLVNDSLVNSSALETQQTAELYLPATNQQVTLGHIYDSFAAGTAFAATWNSIYDNAASVRGVAIDFIPSYSGETNYGLTLKYRDLSRTPEGAAKIMNLIWTDLAAFTTVGTRTGFGTDTGTSMPSSTKEKRSSTTLEVTGQKTVYRRVRVIEYTDIRYAIPAFIVAGLLVFGLLTVIVLILRRMLSYRVLRHYVNQTSMGRTATQIMNPTIAVATATTKEWSRATRDIILDVPRPEREYRHTSGATSAGASLLRRHGRHSSAADVGEDSALETGEQSQSQGGSSEYRPVPRTSMDIDSH